MHLCSTTINLDDCVMFSGIVRFKMLAEHNLNADIVSDCFIRVEFIIFSNLVMGHTKLLEIQGIKVGWTHARPGPPLTTAMVRLLRVQNPGVYGIQNTKAPKLHTTTEGRVTHTYVHTTYFKAYLCDPMMVILTEKSAVMGLNK